MKKRIDMLTKSVIYTFDEGLDPVTQRLDAVTKPNQDYAALHGLAARTGDHAAISRSAENGFTVTERMRRAAIVEMVEHLSTSDDWNMKPKGERVKTAEQIAALQAENAKLMAQLQELLAAKSA